MAGLARPEASREACEALIEAFQASIRPRQKSLQSPTVAHLENIHPPVTGPNSGNLCQNEAWITFWGQCIDWATVQGNDGYLYLFLMSRPNIWKKVHFGAKAVGQLKILTH